MTNVASPAALVIAALLSLAGAGGLLALQIVGGLEYTHGGSLYTQASMIAAMVALALLPVFFAMALRHDARMIAGTLGIAFVAFLAYSLPATSGRTGEIKEAKATAADDVASWRSELAEITKQLNWAIPDKNAECLNAPDPLPSEGWPKCRRKTGTVTALEERRTKLEEQIKAAGMSGATGDLGSALWAWALSWFGVTASTIRKGSVIAFAVGLDFAIWSLVALGERLAMLALAMHRAAKAAKLNRPAWESDTARQSDYPAGALFANHPALLSYPNGSANGSDGGLNVPAAPNRPTKPNAPNGSTVKSPNGPAVDDERRSNVLAFIRQEVGISGPIESQARLGELTGEPASTLSEWLGEFETAGLIERRVEGRCKTISIPARELEMA